VDNQKPVHKEDGSMEALTVTQAARMSGLSSATIKRKIQAGELKAKQNSSGWNQIDPDDLKAFLATAQLGKTKPVQAAQKKARAGAVSEDARLFSYVERDLIEAKGRIKTLEIKLEAAHTDIRKLEAEARASLTGGVTKALSRWIRPK
jgi:hypothetical protein